MNKECPKCKKLVTKKDDHVFVGGKRYHRSCIDHGEYRNSLLSGMKG